MDDQQETTRLFSAVFVYQMNENYSFSTEFFPNDKKRSTQAHVAFSKVFHEGCSMKFIEEHKIDKTETFVFTFTGEPMLYGYTKRIFSKQEKPKAICILSKEFGFEFYKHLLDYIQTSCFNPNKSNFVYNCKALYTKHLPAPNKCIYANLILQSAFTTQVLIRTSNDTIQNYFSLSYALKIFGISTFIELLVFHLLERKILIISNDPEILSRVIPTFSQCITPFKFTHEIASIVPVIFKTTLLATNPYLYGITDEMYIPTKRKSNIIAYNIDTKNYILFDNEVRSLTNNEPFAQLRNGLDIVIRGAGGRSDNRLKAVFEQFFSQIFRSLSTYITTAKDVQERKRSKERYNFDDVWFLKSVCPAASNFLTKFLQTEIFTVFVNERVRLKNLGETSKPDFVLNDDVIWYETLKDFASLQNSREKKCCICDDGLIENQAISCVARGTLAHTRCLLCDVCERSVVGEKYCLNKQRVYCTICIENKKVQLDFSDEDVIWIDSLAPKEKLQNRRVETVSFDVRSRMSGVLPEDAVMQIDALKALAMDLEGWEEVLKKRERKLDRIERELKVREKELSKGLR
ncbi:DENN domain-containing protein 2D [Entamoeba marina]